MNDVFDTFNFVIKFISTHPISKEVSLFIYLLIFTIFLIYKSNSMLDTFERFKFRRFKRLENVLKNKVLTEHSAETDIINFLKEQLAVESFRSINGVKWNRAFQREALKIHNEENNIDIYKLKKANTYIQLKNMRLVVEIGYFEFYFLHFINMWGILAILISIVLIPLTFIDISNIPKNSDFSTLSTLLVIYLFKLLISILFLITGIAMSNEYRKINIAEELDYYLHSKDKANYVSSFKKLPPSWSVYLFWIIFLIIIYVFTSTFFK